MIVRGLRSPSRIKADSHKNLHHTIADLQKQNKELRLQVLKVEQRLIQAQQSKRKYKSRYRETKQKLDILGLVGGLYTQKQQMDPFDGCNSPRTKATRIKTASEDDFLSFKHRIDHSEVEENFSTRPYIHDHEQYPNLPSKRNMTPATTLREPDLPKDDGRIIQSLMKMHEQLEKLSLQIEQKVAANPRIVNIESQLYRKMEQVVEKVSELQVREMERQNRQLSREKNKTSKRYTSSMKALQKIGKELLDFKVDS